MGALPLDGAQVVIESTAVAKKETNPLGLVFISGQGGKAPETAVANLKAALRGAGSDVADMLRVTCFAGSLEDGTKAMRAMETDYHGAALNMAQLQRTPYAGMVECEGVARLRRKAAGPVEFFNTPGMTASPNFSQSALVSAPRLVLTGTQMSYGYQDSDARLAFQRLVKVLDQGGSSVKDVVFTNIYPLSPSLADQVRRTRFDFLDKSHPPAATMLDFDGITAMEGGFAIAVIAIANK